MQDRAASQILGFIVGLAVVTGALAVTAHFMMTVPDTGSDRESTELAGQTQRAMEILTLTAGQPQDWHTLSDLSSDELRRVGLLKEGSTHYARMEKIQAIQNGTLTSDRILESWDINPNTHGLRLEGRVQSVGVGDPPGVPAYGVVHATNPGGPTLNWTVNQTSKTAAELYGEINPDYGFEEQVWQFGREVDPDTGLGNTVYDHAYFIESQLFPMLTGIEATYSTDDHALTTWNNAQARNEMFENYLDTNNQRATYWHVAADGRPNEIPGGPGEPIDRHVFTMAYKRHRGASDSSGWGQWRSEAGTRSAALLGSFDATSASSAQLDFYHALKLDSDDFTVCQDINDDDCVRTRPSIMFWNTTDTNQWTRISTNSSCTDDSGWNDTGTTQATGGSWSNASVDLCEAVEHSDDKLWVSLFWDSSCVDGDGDNETCGDTGNHAVQLWFVDNLELTIDGSTVYENDFEPATDSSKGGFLSEEQVLVSENVDHNRSFEPAVDDSEENTIAYLQNAVRNKTSLLSLSPRDRVGEWLAGVGLATVATNETSDDVVTRAPEEPVMRYPTDLPDRSDDWYQWGTSWDSGDPDPPRNLSLPNDFQRLTTVQAGEENDTTLLTGTPYVGGAPVGAITYNYSSFEDTQLRKQLYENLYTSTVYEDPTFSTDEPVPDSGTREVSSDRSVMLVKVTPNGRYVVPIEVTMWLWQN